MTSKYLMILGLPLLVTITTPRETRRPTILLTLTEDQGAQVGYLGTPGFRTPMIIRTPWLRGGWRTDVLAKGHDLHASLRERSR